MVLTKEYRICMPLTVEEVKSSFRFIQEFTQLDQNIFDLLIFMDIIYYSTRLVSCI